MLTQIKIQKRDLKCLIAAIDKIRIENDTDFLKTMRSILSDIYINQTSIQILKKPRTFVDGFLRLQDTIISLTCGKEVEPSDLEVSSYREVK